MMSNNRNGWIMGDRVDELATEKAIDRLLPDHARLIRSVGERLLTVPERRRFDRLVLGITTGRLVRRDRGLKAQAQDVLCSLANRTRERVNQ